MDGPGKEEDGSVERFGNWSISNITGKKWNHENEINNYVDNAIVLICEYLPFDYSAVIKADIEVFKKWLIEAGKVYDERLKHSKKIANNG